VKIFASFFLFSGLFALLAATPAHAAQDLPFDVEIGEISRKNLQDYFQSALGKVPGDVAIAPVDLNEDGLHEFIVRDKSCDSRKQSCDFKILAENNDKIILLGEIPAYNIALGNAYSQGVRNILAFENAANDYAYAVYVWEPLQSRYMMENQR